MRENSAMTLLEHLYRQLDVLDDLDMNDAEKVNSACKVNKAVNDTSHSILGVAELSVKAIGAIPPGDPRSANLLSGFFEPPRDDRREAS